MKLDTIRSILPLQWLSHFTHFKFQNSRECRSVTLIKDLQMVGN